MSCLPPSWSSDSFSLLSLPSGICWDVLCCSGSDSLTWCWLLWDSLLSQMELVHLSGFESDSMKANKASVCRVDSEAESFLLSHVSFQKKQRHRSWRPSLKYWTTICQSQWRTCVCVWHETLRRLWCPDPYQRPSWFNVWEPTEWSIHFVQTQMK